MLSLIFGPAGSGKTTYIHRLAAEAAATGRKTLLLVPGQFVFSSEQQLLHTDGGSAVQVLSFERMAGLLGAKGSKITDAAAKQALMTVALRRIAPHLETFSRLALHPDFCPYALEAIHQFKTAGLDAEAVARLCERLEDGPLKNKLNDFFLIMGEYDRVLGDRYFDPDDQLRRLLEALQQNNPFAGAAVFADSFSDFTAAEYDLLALLMSSAGSLTVSLCADESVPDGDARGGLFAHTRTTALRLLRIAAEQHVPVEKPRYLDGAFRPGADITRIEAAYRTRQPVSLQSDAVTVCACGSRRTEAEWVCARIRKLVIERGFRYGEMVVICRDDRDWRQLLSSVMAANGIPFYCDFRKPLSQTPAFRFVSAACRFALRPDAATLIACCRSGFCTLTGEETDRLQDYLYVESVRPDALTEPFSDPEIEALRAAAVTPLTAFAQAVEHTDAEGFARAVCELLRTVNAENVIRRLNGVVLPRPLAGLAPDVLRGYNAFMELLDNFVEVLAPHAMTAEQYFSVLERMADTLTLGEIPPVIDAVQFGRADLIRPQNARAVFLIGANDGVFPARPAPLYPFSQRETGQLNRLTEGLGSDIADLLAREEFLVYSALFCAGESISVSYEASGPNGEERPAVFVRKLSDMIPESCRLTYETVPPEERIYTLHQARSALAETEGSVRRALSEALRSADGLSDADACRGGLSRSSQRAPLAGKLLFGGDLRMSSSRVDAFYNCRFRYFCQFGLEVQPLRRNRLDARNYGTAFHYVLEHLLRQYSAGDLLSMPEETLREKIDELLQNSGVPLTFDPDSPDRDRFVQERMCDRLYNNVRGLCEGIADGQFVPADFEVHIGGTEAVIPAYQTRQDGRTLFYSGVIDRVDEYRAPSGQRYFRIADYKTGDVGFKADLLQKGLGLQMLYYAKAALEEGSPYHDAIFAGFLYCPLKPKKDGSPQKMQGLILSDSVVDAAFGTFAKHASAKSVEDFAPHLQTAEQKLIDMARELSEGVFDAVPDDPKNCKSCDYRDVCSHDKNDDPPETEDS